MDAHNMTPAEIEARIEALEIEEQIAIDYRKPARLDAIRAELTDLYAAQDAL